MPQRLPSMQRSVKLPAIEPGLQSSDHESSMWNSDVGISPTFISSGEKACSAPPSASRSSSGPLQEIAASLSSGGRSEWRKLRGLLCVRRVTADEPRRRGWEPRRVAKEVTEHQVLDL